MEVKKKKHILSDSLHKVIDIVKKPFSKKSINDVDDVDDEDLDIDLNEQLTQCGLNVEAMEEELANDEIASSSSNEDDNNKQLVSTNKESDDYETDEPSHKGSSVSFNPSTSFFYTNDKFITAFEDNEIIEYIQQSFPNYHSDNADDILERKTIIEIIGNTKFMLKLLNYYDITIFDFIKFLYRQDQSLFKGQFLKRIQRTLKRKKYVIAAKKQAYRYSPKRKARRKTSK